MNGQIPSVTTTTDQKPLGIATTTQGSMASSSSAASTSQLQQQQSSQLSQRHAMSSSSSPCPPQPPPKPSRGLHLSRNPEDLMIPVSVFCKAFPFHFVCDNELKLCQIGSGFMKLLHKSRGQSIPVYGQSLSTFFVIDQPSLPEPLTFDNILGKTNVSFIIRNIVKKGAESTTSTTTSGQSGSLARNKTGSGSQKSHRMHHRRTKNATSTKVVLSSSPSSTGLTEVATGQEAMSSSSSAPSLSQAVVGKPKTSSSSSSRRISASGQQAAVEGVQIKGQMIYCPESKALLFLGSPLVDGMDSMTSKGLFLSDIPIHGKLYRMV